MNEVLDVAIIGGGPAGSSAGTLLAKAGRRVVVFETEKEGVTLRAGNDGQTVRAKYVIDCSGDFGMRWRHCIFHILIAIQKRTSKVAPKLTLTPKVS